MAFFCNVSGARIAAPGVSKRVDPVRGHDEVAETPLESAAAQSVAVSKAEPVKGEADTTKPAARPGKG